MPVPVQTPTQSAIANGVSVTFPYAFTILDQDDLKVTGTLGGVVTTYTVGVHYSISGVGTDAGAATFMTPPAAGTVVTTYRDTELKRDTDYQDGGDLLAETLDLDLDRIWLALQEFLAGYKVSTRALRVPAGESVSEFPAAAARALTLAGFDALGNATTVVPASQSASALALLLASSVLPTQGAGMVGFNNALTYGAGTIGAYVQTLSAGGGGGYKNLKTDYHCVGDGVTDDTANFLAAIAATQGTHVLFIPAGTYLVNQTLEWTATPYIVGESASLSIIKSSAAGELVRFKVGAGTFWRHLYLGKVSILPTVAGGGTNPLVLRLSNDHTVSGNPAIPDTFSFCADWKIEQCTFGDSSGFGVVFDNPGNLNGFFGGVMDLCLTYNGHALNSFGDSNLFSNILTTDGPSVLAAHGGGRPSFSGTGLPGARQVTFLNCNTTCSGGAYVFNNCEQWRIIGAQAELIVSNKVPYGAGTVPSNNGWITLNNCSGTVIQNSTIGAGGGTSFTATGTTTNGSNSITGLSSTAGLYPGCTIKGTGIPVGARVATVVGTTITITIVATASGTPTLTFGYSPDAAIVMAVGTINTVIENTEVSSGATWHYVIAAGSYNNNTQGLNTYTGISATAQISDANTGSSYNSLEDPPSNYNRDPMFANGFCDLVDGNPANTFPVGFVAGSGGATATQETVIVYGGNRPQKALKILTAGATINNGFDVVPANQPIRYTGWVSGCIALYANNATTGKALLFSLRNGAPVQMGMTTIAGAYQCIPFRFRVVAGETWGLRIACGDGAGAYSGATNIYCGGVDIFEGPHYSQTLQDTLGRRSYTLSAAALPYTPPFVGCHLYNAGTTKWHRAFDATAPGGWGAGWLA